MFNFLFKTKKNSKESNNAILQKDENGAMLKFDAYKIKRNRSEMLANKMHEIRNSVPVNFVVDKFSFKESEEKTQLTVFSDTIGEFNLGEISCIDEICEKSNSIIAILINRPNCVYGSHPHRYKFKFKNNKEMIKFINKLGELNAS